MNKLWLLLSVLVIALFVVSCAPKEVIEGEEIVEEVEEEGGALAGQAISGTCNDPDSVSTFDAAQVFDKSTTIKGTKKWTDLCQTVGGKLILKEGICTKGKIGVWQYSCSKQNKLSGDKFECENGACVNKGTPACVPNCAGKTCGDNGCGGSCGECADKELCLQSGSCISESAYKYGDLNLDGNVNVADLNCMINTVQQLMSGSLPACLKVDKDKADFNCDGDVTVADQTIMINRVNSGKFSAAFDSDGDNIPNCKECVPNCASKTCGDDGCGGICGYSLKTLVSASCYGNQLVNTTKYVCNGSITNQSYYCNPPTETCNATLAGCKWY